VAVPPDDMSHVVVVATVNIKALTSIISDVSSGSSIDSDLLLDLSSPLSDHSWSSNVESLAGLVGDTEGSSEVSSDGSGSGVEHPLTLVSDVVVSSVVSHIEVVDSQSELVSTDVLVPEEVLTAGHLRSDVELNTVSQWLSVGWLSRDGDDLPSLVGSVVAVPPDDMSVVHVSSTMDIKALLTVVPDVLSGSTVELDLLGGLTSEGSDSGVLSDSVTISHSVRKNPVSVVWGSNGVGSRIEGPVGGSNVSTEVSDSEQSLSASVEALVWIEHSSTGHLRSDHESDSVSDWEPSVLGLVVLDLHHLDLGDGPSLVVAVVAFVEGHWLVVLVSSLPDVKAEALVVSDVSLTARVEVEDLLLLTSPGSDDHSSVLGKAMSVLVGDDEVSLGSGSHGLGSSVEDPPRSLVLWVGVLDSKSV
jgi:hypothetical protein